MKTTASPSPASHTSIGFLLRRAVALLTLLALVVFPSSSALATQVDDVEFAESGHYPHTIFVTLSSTTSGATIFYTIGQYWYADDPTHNGSTPINCQVYFTPIGVPAGTRRFIKAVAYKSGMTDSNVTLYEVDNTGL